MANKNQKINEQILLIFMNFHKIISLEWRSERDFCKYQLSERIKSVINWQFVPLRKLFFKIYIFLSALYKPSWNVRACDRSMRTSIKIMLAKARNDKNSYERKLFNNKLDYWKHFFIIYFFFMTMMIKRWWK
jgi:hypothetical protein